MICRREKIKRSWLTTHRDIVQRALDLATSKVTNGTPAVPAEMVQLARNVIRSNVIYDHETEADRLRSKRVIKELNRLAKVDQLRKRPPNPYEKKYTNIQLKRRGDTPEIPSHDPHVVVPFKKTPTKINGSKVNGSSLLLKSVSKSLLSPKKSSSSSENRNTCRHKHLKSPIKSQHKNRDPRSLLQPFSTRSTEGNKKKRPNEQIKNMSNIRIKHEDEGCGSGDGFEEEKPACCVN